jgi:hypothetical protein
VKLTFPPLCEHTDVDGFTATKTWSFDVATALVTKEPPTLPAKGGPVSVIVFGVVPAADDGETIKAVIVGTTSTKVAPANNIVRKAPLRLRGAVLGELFFTPT